MTLKKIIQTIQNLCESHRQISDFRFGDFWEFDVNGDIKYASSFLELINASINQSDRYTTYNFRIYFFDRVMSGEENELDVLSDMSDVAIDFAAMIIDPAFDDDFDASAGTMQKMTETLGDMVAGFVLDFSINVHNFNDRCQIPKI
jgi:hypothetical protein